MQTFSNLYEYIFIYIYLGWYTEFSIFSAKESFSKNEYFDNIESNGDNKESWNNLRDEEIKNEIFTI